LVLKETLGGGRFLKSVQCVHDEGLLLVKVYFKRGEFIDLKEYERKLHEIREKLKDIEHSHVWPFQVSNSLLVFASNSESYHQVCFSEIRSLNKLVFPCTAFQYWLETDKAAYLLRQYFFSNLHDRISTRPFLSVIEKKWLAFQVQISFSNLKINVLEPQNPPGKFAYCVGVNGDSLKAIFLQQSSHRW
jgi:phosphoinositide-3-kinase regulatory subunit 4